MSQHHTMKDSIESLRPWVAFAGSMLLIAVLYWAQAVIVPVAVAVLLTFTLSPLVTVLQRAIGRAPAALLVVVATFAVLGAGTYMAGRQMLLVAADLPSYRQNIRAKLEDIRGIGKGSSVEKVQQTIEAIEKDVAKAARPGSVASPLVVESQHVAGLWGFPLWLGSILEPLATAMLITVLVIFMLLEREDLRDRLLGVIGFGHVATTTRALEEAATRVSRFLLVQSAVNLLFGMGVALGLWLLGVPYALLWAMLSAVLRFIPYVGPLIGFALPAIVSLAVFPVWTQTLYVVGLYVALELFTNLVLETVLYAGVAGVSQVALLIAVAFWAWLWGPLGLLLATPLTVCLVVLGRHLPGFEFVATLMSDSRPLTPQSSYYQRLLARDQSGASDLIDHHLKDTHPASVFDALLLPALNFAERDRLEDRLSEEEEQAVIDSTRELIEGIEIPIEQRESDAADDVEPRSPLSVLCYPATLPADGLALEMLEHLLRGTDVTLTILSNRVMASELITTIKREGHQVICIADLPPSAPTKTRYLIKRIKASVPHAHVLVGRWAPPGLADEDAAPLRDAGAAHVASSLEDTKNQLCALASQLETTTVAKVLTAPSDRL